MAETDKTIELKLSKLLLNYYKPLTIQIFQIWAYFFRFMGLGRFSECGLVHCLLWLRKWINTKSLHTSPSHQHQFTDHIILCECQQSLPDWELCFVISVSVPWVCLLCQPARWLEVCQHARGSSQCPESPDIMPLCQMVAVPVLQRLYSWFGLFACNDDLVCFTLSCDGLLAVFVTIYC